MTDAELRIRLSVQQDGSIDILSTSAGDIRAVKQAADDAAQSNKTFGDSYTELQSKISVFTGTLKGFTDLAADLNATGAAALRTSYAFNVLASPDQIKGLDAMRAGAKGLATDWDLMAVATKGMTAGVLRSAQDMGEMARIGTVLGEVFSGNAVEGIRQFERALQQVGNVRGLRTLGLDATTIQAEFKKLKDSGIDAEDAWRKAVLEYGGLVADKLGGATDLAGAAVERLGKKWETVKTQVSEVAVTILDQAVTAAEQLSFILSHLDMSGGKRVNLDQTFNPFQTSAQRSLNALNVNQVSGGGFTQGSSETLLDDARVKLAMGLPLSDSEYKAIMGSYGFGTTPPSGWGQMTGTQASGYGPAYSGGSLGPNLRDLNIKGGAQPGRVRDEYDQGYSLGAPMPSRNLNYAPPSWFYGTEPQGQERGSRVDTLTTMKAGGNVFDFISQAASGFVDKIRQGADDFNSKAAEGARQRALTVADYSGVQGGTAVETEGTRTIQGAFSEARQAKLAELTRRYGKTGAEKKIEAFDADQKDAMDKYLIATGQATEKSVAYTDAQDKLKASLKDGTITAKEYTDRVLDLAKALESGTFELPKVARQKVERHKMLTGEGRWSEDKATTIDEGKGSLSDTEALTRQAGEKAMKGWVDTIGNALTHTVQQIVDLPGKISTFADNSLQPFKTVATNAKPAIDAFTAVNDQISKIQRIRSIKIQVATEYTSSTTSSAGGGRGAGANY